MLKNEINWYQWNSDSLKKAKDENRAIFLFIYEPSSRYAKAMNQESFSNQHIVELLNERFIPIKVEKNIRPDIERFFQRVHHLMNRQSHLSPLSIFLTQELKPFYAASYIPPHDIDAQLGFENLLRVISKKYITDYNTLNSKGDEVLNFIEPKEERIEATRLNLLVTKTIESQIKMLLDNKNGGFTKAPKFPNTSTLELLLDLYAIEKNSSLLSAIRLTLDKMISGGFYDLNRGGFYAYATDEEWRIPAGEKTTYNNALLSHLYLRAYQYTHNETYKNIAFKTLDFMLQNQKENGLFSINDEPLIISWNALMVKSLLLASNYKKSYKSEAFKVLEAILQEFYIDGRLYHYKDKNNKEKVAAFLEDYSYLGETLICAYEYSLDESFLIMATQFSNLLIEHYYQQGKWIYSSNEFKVRESIHDITLPSSLSTALSLLMSISSLVDVNYKKFVFKTLELHSYNLMRQPLASPKLTQVMLRYLKDDLIIKSNEKLLKENIDKRVKISYPYLFFKTTLDKDFQLYNSHSLIFKDRVFEKLISHIESME